MKEIERRLRSAGGVLDRRSNPDLTGQIDRGVRVGQLVPLLPGVYCAPDAVDDFGVRVAAASQWAGPDAVFTGRTAARLSYWPGCPSTDITLAVPVRGKRARPGFDVESRRLGPELTLQHGSVLLTSPAVTAVDLAGGPDAGDAIDRCLRSRQATLAQMWDALRAEPHRAGNAQRAYLLHDSRDEPWSEAERLQHRLLRAAGIDGWRTNQRVFAAGISCIVDVLFRTERVVLEVDGWDIHGTREAFEADRRRRNHLVLEGYLVLNITWRQLVDDPEWVVRCVRDALQR